MRLGIRAGLAIGALLLVGLPLPTMAAETRTTLGAVTVLSGTRSASVPVRLARPTTIRDPLFADGAGGDLAVTTTGRYAGFVLVQEGVKTVDRIVVVGGRFPEKSRKLNFVYAASGLTGAASWRLPAGNYRLHLVTDNKPATVRLRLLGPSGTTRLAPRTTSRARLVFPKPDVDVAGARTTYAVGAGTEVVGQAVYFSGLYAAYPAHVDTVYSNCFYFGRPSGPSPYLPGCPSPEERHLTPVSLPPSTGEAARHLVLNSFSPLATGAYAGGTSFVSATPASDVSYFQLWLTY